MENLSKRVDGKTLKEEKRRRFQAKQEESKKRARKQYEYEEWCFKHEHFANLVTKSELENQQILEHLDPYFNLKTNKQRENNEKESLFIAEGSETVRLLIQCQEFVSIKSIFIKPSLLFEPPVLLQNDIEKLLNQRDDDTTPGFRVFIAEEDVMSRVAGFHIARGAFACGVIPTKYTETWLLDHLQTIQKDEGKTLRLLALDGICDTANLGSMIRTASAFGIDAIILGSNCCDAWYRRSIRVSMGHIFRVPCVRVASLEATLRVLAKNPFRVLSYAAVVDENANMVLETMGPILGQSWCCVMGNEGKGISSSVLNSCTSTIRIDMAQGVDSLSVPVATGILLHGLKERETR